MGKGMIKWCHNDHGTWHHLWKKLHKKDFVGIVTFDLINWLTSHQPHYCLYYLQWHTGVCEEMFDVNSTIAQTKQSIWKIPPSESRFYKKWQTMAIIREISDSNLETGRNGSKSGVSRIIRESWQPCVYSQTPFFGHLLNKDTSLLQTVCFVPGERKSLSYP